MSEYISENTYKGVRTITSGEDTIIIIDERTLSDRGRTGQVLTRGGWGYPKEVASVEDLVTGMFVLFRNGNKAIFTEVNGLCHIEGHGAIRDSFYQYEGTKYPNNSDLDIIGWSYLYTGTYIPVVEEKTYSTKTEELEETIRLAQEQIENIKKEKL